ncbi:MAG: SEC-C metal-binding domain-containing protein [Defluviitaleaceae bacterium]|nr:SEC-C metal-binding domain-containing protein [Defluviitaleaceae bacterium]MCL2835136.1 SEC-C metal-binding domain-containing protein [Defluviitaleaceae bacterium]
MSLYEAWIKAAYDSQGQSDKTFWKTYMPVETRIYEDLLTEGQGALNAPLMEFAKKYGLKPEHAVGFLDGIGGAIDSEIDAESITEDYIIDIKFDYEKLFRKMVEYKARHLYTLPQWSAFFDVAAQERMIEEQRRSGTYVAGEKPGRNDPCACGSGKKYKKCCGSS